jgi:hypothetical protein
MAGARCNVIRIVKTVTASSSEDVERLLADWVQGRHPGREVKTTPMRFRSIWYRPLD